MSSYTPDISFPRSDTFSSLESILENSTGFSPAKSSESYWYFIADNPVALDFSILEDLDLYWIHWYEHFDPKPSEYLAYLFLLMIEGLDSVSIYRRYFDGLVKIFIWLYESDTLNLNRGNLKDCLSFFLMHTVEGNRLVPRTSPVSYSVFLQSFQVRKISRLTRLANSAYPSIIDYISHGKVLTDAKEVLIAVSGGELPFSDWRDGGSLDRLPLDYGRYYVDHCYNFFFSYAPYAIAMKKTIASANQIAHESGCPEAIDDSRYRLLPIIRGLLSGDNADELEKRYRKSSIKHYIKRIMVNADFIFSREAKKAFIAIHALSQNTIGRIFNTLNIFDYTDADESHLRECISLYLSDTNEVFNNYSRFKDSIDFQGIHCLKQFSSDQIIQSIYKVLNELENKAPDAMPCANFFYEACIDLNRSKKSKFFHEFCRMVDAAGLTLFVAFTGWRESEFGFALKDISIERNPDTLDHALCPYRYHVNWRVPKTHGDRKVKREISQKSFLLACQLAHLSMSGRERPSLYSCSTKRLAANSRSSSYVKHAIRLLWSHYVNAYEPFIALRSADFISKTSEKLGTSPLTPEEKEKRDIILNRFTKSDLERYAADSRLRKAFERAESELERVEFLFQTEKRRHVIWSYINNRLNEQTSRFIDKHLSPEVKAAIMRISSECEISRHLSNAFISSITDGCIYPTAHGFRHMWAEAVYRRFDGDVGWIIRSHFKHISQAMWLAYVKDKNNFRISERTKRDIASSLVYAFLSRNDHRSVQGFHSHLERLIESTKVSSIDNLSQVDKIVKAEFSDLKSTPWGYCLVFKGGKRNAKCQSNGELQRQNAQPNLCLRCENNIVSGGHIEGILLATSNDVRVVQNSNIPAAYRATSSQTLKAAVLKLESVGANSEETYEIKNALKAGESNVYKSS